MATKMNAQDFFASRMNDMALQEESSTVNDRFNQMIEARQRRSEELGVIADRRKEVLAKNRDSIVGKLGLNEDGLTAQATNLAASAVSGAGRVAGHILSAPSSLAAAAETANLNQADWEAYTALKNAEATPEQMAQLNRDAGSQFSLGNITRALQGNFNNATPLERIEAADGMRGAARSINNTMDWSGIVHQGRRADMSDDLRTNFESNWSKVKEGGMENVASGIAGLLSEAGKAAVNNPGAVAEYVAENIPQLGLGMFGAAGKAGLAASNVGYAADNFQKGIEKFQESNNGAYPDIAQREEMAMWAAATALAEQVGDVSMLRGIGGAASDVVDAGRRSLLSAAKEGAKGVGTEAATEGFQTYAEGQAGLNPASAFDIYEGAVIGGLSGGVMQGGGAAIGVAGQKVAEAAQAQVAQATSRQENKGKFDEAVEKNDPSFFSTVGKNYAPDEAVRVLVTAATEDNTEENQTKANEVVATAQTRLEDLQGRIERASNPEESKTAIQDQIDNLEWSDKTHPSYDPEMAQMEMEQLQEDMQLVDQDAKRLSTLKTNEAKLKRQVDTASRTLDQFTSKAVAEEVAEATTPEAASKTINLAMSAPTKVDSKTVQALVEDTTNALTEDQRKYLRAFDEARVAENKAKTISKVNTDVLYGSNKDVGIKQYRERTNRALVAGNIDAAQDQVKALESFTASHVSKAAAMQQAFDEAVATGETFSVARNKTGNWEILPEVLSAAQAKKTGSLNIHPRSNGSGLIDAAQYEAQAAQAAVAELQAAVAVKQGNVSTAPVQAAVAPTAPVAPTTPAPVAVTSSGAASTGAPASTLSKGNARVMSVKAKASMNYLNNPPMDFSAVKAKEMGDWATKQVERIEAEQKTTDKEDFDRQDELSDLKSTMKELQAKSKELVKSEAERVAHEEENVAPEGREPAVESTPDVMMVQNASGTQAQSPEASSVETLTNDSKQDTKSVKEKGFKKINQIVQYFKQVAKRDTDTTAKPLAASDDFLSQWLKNDDLPLDFLTEELDEKQSNALFDFKQKAKSWLPKITTNLPTQEYLTKNSDFRFLDPIQYMVVDKDGKSDIAESVKTAIAFAAYSWLYENANMPRFHTMEDVKEMYGVDEHEKISKALYSAIREAGSMEKTVMNSMGQKAVAALGLKVDKSAPADAMARLESSIGSHALKLLEDKGLVKRTKVDAKVIAEGLPKKNSKDTNQFADQGFIAPARDEDGNLGAVGEEIRKAQSGTQSILNKLFGAESEYKEPSLVPITKVQNTTKNTDQLVPNKLKKIIKHENSVPNYLRQDTWRLVSSLDDESVLAIAGAVSTDPETLHKVNRESVEAKNEGLARELVNARQYFATLAEGAAMYFEHSVWKQQRVGIATNLINPQTSKIHRFMMFRPEWETKVDMNDAAMMDNFKIRVAEGLGVKADKQANTSSLIEFEALVKKEEIKRAVNAIRQTMIQGKDMTPAHQEAIVAGVKKGGENMHSLDGLIALAQYAEAKANGSKEFTTHMMGEVDGVTNGPMLSHLMMGAAATASSLFEMLNRGGFYSLTDEHRNYNLWRASEGNQDLYESTIANVMNRVRAVTNTSPAVKAVMGSLYSITGALEDKNQKVVKAGRNIIKTPLTAMVFGSSIDGAISSMFDKFLDTTYEKIEKLENQEQATALVENLNALIRFGGGRITIDPKSTIADLLNMEFSRDQEKALEDTFNATLGKAVKETMDADFAIFMDARKTYNTAAQAAFQLYEAARLGLTDQLMNELMDSGDLEFNVVKGVRTPLHDLTGDQRAELDKRLAKVKPLLQTAFSQDDENRESGLAISKSSRKLATSPQYQGTSHFGSPTVDGASTRKFSSYERTLSAPGVAMLPMGAHSADSAISHTALEDSQVLNVHDAHGTGLQHFIRTAQNLNKATWETMLTYSPANQMQASLNETVQGMAELLKNSTTAAAIAPYLKSAIKPMEDKINKERKALAKENGYAYSPIPSKDVLAHVMQDIAYMAAQADRIKFETMAQMAAVDQYALEGGQYDVTDADRARATKNLAEVTFNVGEENKTAAAAIVKAFTTTPKPMEADGEFDAEPTSNPVGVLARTVSPVIAAATGAMKATSKAITEALEGSSTAEQAKVAQTVQKAAKALKTAFSPWGEIGTSTVNHDEALVQALEAKPVMNKKEALTALKSALVNQQAPKNIKEFNAKLFTVLAKVMPADVKIKYVTPTTDATEIMEKGASAARGWYVAQNNEAAIYILSTDHQNSAVTPEVMLHEMVHATLAGIVENVATQPADVQALVADLNNLMVKAQKHIGDNNLDQFAPAVENIHEFIAYGMTNLAFQKEVMSQISMQSKTKGNALVQGMKAFIQNITSILFRGSDKSTQAIAVNGMSILIGNVSGLMAAVAQTPSKASIILNAKSVDPLAQANELNTVELFEAIKSPNPDNQNSAEFEFHMSSVLDRVVEKLHGPFGTIKAALQNTQALTPTDVFAKSLATGELPFASKAIAAGFKINDQESFVMDQVMVTVQAATENSSQVTIAHRELRKVFAEARKKITPESLLPTGVTKATASQADLDAAQALWDFAFKAEANTAGTSDYLSGFAAVSIGHEQFAKAMGFETDVNADAPTNMWERVVAAYDMIMDWVAGHLTGTRAGDVASDRVNKLVESLVDIEAKRRVTIAQQKETSVEKFEAITRDMSDKAKNAISDFGNSKFFKNSKNGFVRFTGTAMNLVAAPERVEVMLEKMQEIRDKTFKDRQGIAASLVTEMQGITDEKEVFGKLLLATKNNERARKEAITHTANFIQQSFTTEMTKEETKNVTNTYLRTDLSALIGDFDMKGIAKLVSDNAFRKAEITKLEQALANDPNTKFYMNGAKGLGYYMATGFVRIPHMLMNAHNIARLGGYNTQAVAEDHAVSLEPTIDKLVSLYALDYLSQAERNGAAKVLTEEAKRTDGGNGIEMILKLHKKLQDDSKKHLFEGNDALFMKGYTTEIYNPYVNIVVADQAEGNDLVKAGYVQGADVKQDTLDAGSGKAMYVIRDGGLLQRLTGTLSFTGLRARGTAVRGDTLADKNRLMNAKLNEMAQMNAVSFDPAKVTRNYMAPVLNNQGEVSDYRYMMNKNTKDSVLERDNRFDKILGAYAGSVMDKQVSPVQNKAVVQALFDQFDGEDQSQKDRYLEISATATDPVMREHWNLLPEATKKAVKEIWGGEVMWVRPDMIDLNFGYRKYSLANVFAKDVDERNAMEKIFTSVVESLVRAIGGSKGLQGKALDDYVAKSGLFTRRAEDVWQELVKEAKDIIVVRSGIVLLGNISSNLTELVWMGVPLKDIVRHHQVALKAASDYQKDSERLSQVEMMLESGYIEGSVAELEQEAVRLRDAINRNPVKELIDAGLMPTIAEDLGQDEDLYSYKSRFARKTGEMASKMNPTIKAAAKQVYINQDTGLYKALNRTTQLSDFVARYTLFQHLTTRNLNPLSKDAAVRYASDAFVNYDIPSHRTVQYLNDMGIVMFTKYYIRIQKVLMRMFRENPARAMMMMAFSHFFSDIPSVVDGSMLNKMSYNPFSSGAFKYPGVLDDLATVKVGLSPFN